MAHAWKASLAPVALLLMGAAFFPDLNHRWELEKVDPFSTVSPELQRAMKNSHVVFVTGSFNELSPGWLDRASSWRLYFGNNMASVKDDLGASAEIYNPSTAQGIEANARLLAMRMDEISSKEQPSKRIDIFAHSMGGSVALYAYLSNATFRQQVGRLILIQPSIGGAIDGAFYEDHQDLCAWFPWLVDGLKDQSPTEATRLFNEVHESFCNRVDDATYNAASNSIFFVQGRDDSVVPLKGQSHPSIGIALDPLPVGHLDLVVWLLGASSADQRAFTRAIFGLAYGMTIVKP